MRLLKTVLMFVLLMMIVVFAHAQDGFEDFFDSADPEFLELLEETEARFTEMRVLDAEFAEILNRAWQELELSTGIVPDSQPKPTDIPSARPSEAPPVQQPRDAVPVEPEPESVLPEITPETISRYGTPITFFRTTFPLKYDKSLDVTLGGTVAETSIGKYWETLSNTGYGDAVAQLMQVKEQLGLNDWGYCMLLDDVVAVIQGTTAPERPLLVWFLLVKSGYDARVGYSGNRIYVLLPSLSTVYNSPYYELDGTRYYLTPLGTGTVTNEVTSLYTYEGTYKEAKRSIDYSLPVTPDISKVLYEKPVAFIYDGNKIDITLKINKNMVDFYEYYPQTNLNVYFSAPVTTETAQSLLDSLRPEIADRDERDAANLLLRFVQTGFPYRTDGDQFGREKFMFPEETLYYPYSDCEDRSFLFAYLVSKLLELDVIGLDYPGHVATAVRFTVPVSGDSVDYDGIQYIICDPTYINADCGESMPAYRDISPGIVPFTLADR